MTDRTATAPTFSTGQLDWACLAVPDEPETTQTAGAVRVSDSGEVLTVDVVGRLDKPDQIRLAGCRLSADEAQLLATILMSASEAQEHAYPVEMGM